MFISSPAIQITIRRNNINRRRLMGFERETFAVSGPKHLLHDNWNNEDHRRSVAASLVQAVYVLEIDRQAKRQGQAEALAPPWWEFSQFRVTQLLIDKMDSSIFGAIFELNTDPSFCRVTFPNAPKYVIAFRGTLPRSSTVSQDLKLDFQILRHKLEESSRYQLAMQAVKNMRSYAEAGNLWIAGHSLGSAIGMLVGKNMAKSGISIESYFFNPPFISAPLEKISNDKVKHGILFTHNVIKAGVAVAVKGSNEHSRDISFASLSSWLPILFVNPSDHISSGYIGYFEHRAKLDDIGASAIGKLGSQNSMGCLLLGAIGGKDREPCHYVPSAYLVINKSVTPDLKHSHGLHQW